jgi:hypothetical protein
MKKAAAAIIMAAITVITQSAPIAAAGDLDAELIAKMLWGEARGIESDMEKAACAWAVLNRVDAGGYGDSVKEVVTARKQFVGYKPGNPVDGDLLDLAEDVLGRWRREKDGESDVGRVLPADYLWFSGNGVRNRFRNKFKGGEYWDWSLPDPYKDGEEE